MNAWAQLHDAHLIDVFHDDGISGKSAENRPGLHKALQAACANQAALVVYSLDRLGRNLVELLEMSERLNTEGADLVSLTERIDTTTASGKMIFCILCVLAQFEREQIAERTREAMQLKKLRGESTGKVPYGWDLGEDGKTLVENGTEQIWIRRMVSWRATGKGIREIARKLTEGGVTGKNGKQSWTHSTVSCILQRYDDEHGQPNAGAAGGAGAGEPATA